MPKRSSDSVKIEFADKKKVLTEAGRVARSLADAHPEILEVYLFGSYAREDYFPHSDVDLLLVLDKADLPFPERAPRYSPGQTTLPIELFPYSQAELSRRQAEGDFFIEEILREGVLLFRRPKKKLA